MIETRNFKTKSEIVDQPMPKINGNNQHKGKTIVALDIGYSAVKGVSPNRIFRFPSFAKKAPDGLDIVAKVKQYDIQLKDNTSGEVWLVGQVAEDLMDQRDLDSTTDESLYSRFRYESPVFKVLASAGLALGLIGTGSGNDIYVQTGLPATYKERDEGKLKKALCGHYDIEIKVGNGKWMPFVFDLTEDTVDVMEQPQGTLCSTMYQASGELSKTGVEIAKSNTIILDIGFGTEDLFSFKHGYKNSHKTYSDTGMKAVFEETIKRIQRQHPDASFKIFEFQKYLESGVASYFDIESFGETDVAFADILEEVNRELCDKSINRLMTDYDNLMDYNYLIVTGGTGESRYEMIRDKLSKLKKLQVMPGNVTNPNLPFVYSNVLGYYMVRHAKLQAEMRKGSN